MPVGLGVGLLWLPRSVRRWLKCARRAGWGAAGRMAGRRSQARVGFCAGRRRRICYVLQRRRGCRPNRFCPSATGVDVPWVGLDGLLFTTPIPGRSVATTGDSNRGRDDHSGQAPRKSQNPSPVETLGGCHHPIWASSSKGGTVETDRPAAEAMAIGRRRRQMEAGNQRENDHYRAVHLTNRGAVPLRQGCSRHPPA